jgi:hypothetical protein
MQQPSSKYELDRRFQQQVTRAALGFLVAIFSSLVPHFWWMSLAGADNQGIFRALALGVFCILAGSFWLLSTDAIARNIQQRLNWSTKTYVSCWAVAAGIALAGWAIPMVVGG